MSSVPMHARNLVREPRDQPAMIPTARVNLLPPEIEVGRRVRDIKHRTVLVLAAVLVLALATFGWFKFDESRAYRALSDAQATVTDLRAQQVAFAELPKIAIVTRNIDGSLATVMANDVAWDRYLDVLLASAPDGIVLTSVGVVMQDVTDAAAGVAGSGTSVVPGALDVSGQEHVGVLTLTGQAPSHDVAATWVTQLEAVDGFRVPYILGSRIVVGAASIEFTIEVTLTSALRTLRYAPAVPAVPAPDGAATTRLPSATTAATAGS
jgi:hypothetical protein